jgi:hypothetical protein
VGSAAKVSAPIDKAETLTNIVPWLQRRIKIVAEAREIVNKINVPAPHSYSN